MWQIHVAFL
jgi:hypothetical protein